MGKDARCEKMKHLVTTHPCGEGAGLYLAAHAQGTGWRDGSPRTPVSFSLCPAASLRAHRGQSKGCAAPPALASDLLQAPSGPPWARSYLLQCGPEGGRAGMGSQEAPLTIPVKLHEHPFCTRGSYLATPRVAPSPPTAHIWEGDNASTGSSLSQATPWGVPPSCSPTRKEQSG